MVCHVQDDLRKDGKLMEFNTIMNKVRRMPKAYICTYSDESFLMLWTHFEFIAIVSDEGSRMSTKAAVYQNLRECTFGTYCIAVVCGTWLMHSGHIG